ncbi:MAG: delta(1)-pyrroline-2-carboxylate reductase family protein [Burkholderiaceae bacterium]
MVAAAPSDPDSAGLLDAAQTAQRLPWAALSQQISAVLQDPSVRVVPRLVLPLPGGASLFVMPACDARIAITKLITFTPANAAQGRPAIQGDVIVFDVATGERCLVLHGPTVTARRTAAVSLLAAQRLAAQPRGPLLIVGAGVQGRAHLEAFAQGLGVQSVWVASRSTASARALVQHARTLGLQANVAPDPNAALADCPLAVVCTPAHSVVLDALPRSDAFVAAVGAFTPHMRELGAALCQHFSEQGRIVIDTADAAHEAGDLLQAGLDAAHWQLLADVVSGRAQHQRGPVLFKSCGWAGWDLAAARLATF